MVFNKNLIWDVDLTVTFGDLILFNVVAADKHVQEGRNKRHIGIVMATNMDNSGTITAFSLDTITFYQTSGIARAIRKIAWTDAITKAANGMLHGYITDRTNPTGDAFARQLPLDVPIGSWLAGAAEYLRQFTTPSVMKNFNDRAALKLLTRTEAEEVINQAHMDAGIEPIDFTASTPIIGDERNDL